MKHHRAPFVLECADDDKVVVAVVRDSLTADICDLPIPISKSQLQRFLGLVNFYSLLIPNCDLFSKLTFKLMCFIVPLFANISHQAWQ